jgi:hypothetical protein
MQARTAASYGELPLSFEVNQGQAKSAVRYLARGPGYALFLTPTESILSLRSGGGTAPRDRPDAVIRMRLAGANPEPQLSGVDRLPGTINYFLGDDPTHWRSAVPTYAKVKYDDVYPGIDLVYYGNQRTLEFDFVVAAGADPSRVRLVFDGVEKLSLDREGNLVLATAVGNLVQRKPVIYQDIDGIRRTIEGGYRLRGKRQASFDVARYDRTRPLVIDPTLTYSTYLGGSNADRAHAIAADATGNVYVTGFSYGSFPTTPGAYQTTGGINGTIFVSKLKPTGSALVYSTYLGGAGGSDSVGGIAVDASGNAYLTGSTRGGFPTTPGAHRTTFGGGIYSWDAFVTKLNPTGTALVYSTYLGATISATGAGIAVDTGGNAYLTGATSGGLPTTPGAYQGTIGGFDDDIFVTKLNATGTALVYSTYVGGYFTEVGSAIAVDGSGNAYVTGLADYTLPTTPGAFQPQSGGSHADAFVTKLNAAGSALVYSTFLGGSAYDYGRAIAVDSSGNAYVTGETSSGFPTTAGAYQTVPGGGDEAFVSKLNATGSALVYSTYLGGADGDRGLGIAVDGSGSAYVTGYAGGGFPTTPSSVQTFGGIVDAFLTKLNATGSALVYSTFLGGAGADEGTGIAMDASGAVYVAGFTEGGFPITPSAFQSNYGGMTDAFVARLAISAKVNRGIDLNGDGRSDLLWRNAGSGETQAWLMSGTVPVAAASLLTDPTWLVERVGDFNGDGRTDLIWHNSTNGQTAIWLMSGPSFIGGAVLMTSLQWRVMHVADFDGDGKSDLVWRNSNTGETAIWLMNGVAYASGAVLLTSTAWSVTHVADFNGDGKSDVLWRNSTTGETAIWLMNGANFSGGAVILTSAQWSVTHAADFTNDGRADLVWRNATTGETAIWLMNGASFTGGAVVLVNAQWAVTHVADFNGDGHFDLIWRNAGTGSTAMWLMNGSTMTTGAMLLTGTDWAVTRTDDYNGDGGADLIWRHSVTGETAMWIMSGTTPTTGAAPLFVPSFAVQ